MTGRVKDESYKGYRMRFTNLNVLGYFTTIYNPEGKYIKELKTSSTKKSDAIEHAKYFINNIGTSHREYPKRKFTKAMSEKSKFFKNPRGKRTHARCPECYQICTFRDGNYICPEHGKVPAMRG